MPFGYSNPFFDSRNSIRTATIGDSVQRIPANLFRGCDNLTSINIPSSVTSIGRFAFEGCHSLTNVVVPDSVTTIEDCAFMGVKEVIYHTTESGTTREAEGMNEDD